MGFFCYWVVGILHIFWVWIFGKIFVLHFLSIVVCFLIILMISFDHRSFEFWWNIFYDYYLFCPSMKYSPSLRSQGFFLCFFFPRSFRILPFGMCILFISKTIYMYVCMYMLLFCFSDWILTDTQLKHQESLRRNLDL